MIYGVLATLVASGFFSLSNLLQKRAVDGIPPLSVRRLGHMATRLLTSKMWLAGFFSGIAAVVFMVIGYSLAPITVIQSIYGIGLIVLVVASHLHLGERLARREWASIAVVICAAVMISLTLGTTTTPGLGGSLGRVLAVSGGTVVAAGLVFALLGRSSAERSIPFGAAAGLVYGAGSLQIKSASVLINRYGIVHGALRALASPYPYLFVALSLLGLVIFQIGLQRTRVAAIGPITNIVAAAYVVGVGMVLYDEPLPKSALLSALRFAGFALVLAGSAVFGFGERNPEPAPATTEMALRPE